ncbi:MAG: hypothetical protein ACRDTM_01625 [Micromonosporaceae bacterium]
MLRAVIHPAAFAGLLLAFLLGLAVRVAVQVALAQRLLKHRVGSVLPHPRRDIDPFGAIAAALGGTGWGRRAPLPDTGWLVRRPGRRAAVLAAGPLAVIAVGLAVLAGYQLAYPDNGFLAIREPSDVLTGAPGPVIEQLWGSLGTGLLCFGVLALVPLPPLDGWWLAWLLSRQPGESSQKVRFWLEERNLGVVILLVFLVIPLGTRVPLLLVLLDVVATPLMRLAAW